MMTETWKEIPNMPTKKCFGCGPANEIGLQLKFFTNGEVLKTTTIIPEHLIGWSNLAHGGIISTILDEIMAWTGIYLQKKFILTKSLSCEYAKPIPVGMKIFAVSRIDSIEKGKDCHLSAEILNADGVVMATGKSVLRLFSLEEMKKLSIFPDEFLDEFAKTVFP